MPMASQVIIKKMNRISFLQNENNQLRMLAAQRFLYSSAKTLFNFRLSSALAISVICPFLSAIFSGAKPYIGLISLIYLLLDYFVFENIEKNKKINAAKIQELFDMKVLNIKWNGIVAGNKPDLETIVEAANNFKGDHSKLKDWYPKKVSKLENEIGALICQRCNIYWDAKLRRTYASSLTWLMLIITFFLFFISVYFNESLNEVLLNILPFIPLYRIIIEQIRSNLLSAKMLDELKGSAEDFLDQAMEKRGGIELKNNIRILQDEIFRYRKSNPFIPDVVYFKLRNKYESIMNFSADIIIKEFINK